MDAHTPTPKLTKLIRGGMRQTYKREEPIFDTGNMDGIYQVASGFVKRFEIMNNGAINVQGIYGRGDVFSLTYVFKLMQHRKIYNGPETYYYEALGSTTVYKLLGTDLKAALEKDPLLYRDLFSIAGDHFSSDIYLLENQSLPTAEKRVAHLLSFYIECYGKQRRDGIHLIAPLTQQDVADILSLTRETVSLAISSLRENGILANSRKIIVPDKQKLSAAAYE